MRFDRFIGIDWSGAKGPRLPGLAVAEMAADAKGPQVVANPRGGHWTRPDLLHWLTAQLQEGGVLVGADFSFAPPFMDTGAYLPSLDTAQEPETFWRDVAGLTDHQIYAGGFVRAHADWFLTSGGKGAHYQRRMRITEVACKQQGGGAPECLFHLIGPKQVGLSSLSGMAFLHNLRDLVPNLAIWPFDTPQTGQSVIVETYPALWARRVGHTTKIRTQAALEAVLQPYGAMALASELDDHVADALLTAAALRRESPHAALWQPETGSVMVRAQEGWTFGVL